ncbi:unnamed protein product, partial [Polarella glacialis]
EGGDFGDLEAFAQSGGLSSSAGRSTVRRTSAAASSTAPPAPFVAGARALASSARSWFSSGSGPAGIPVNRQTATFVAVD